MDDRIVSHTVKGFMKGDKDVNVGVVADFVLGLGAIEQQARQSIAVKDF